MNTVTEHKSAPEAQREVKQTEMSKSGSEKSLLQGPIKENG